MKGIESLETEVRLRNTRFNVMNKAQLAINAAALSGDACEVLPH